MKQYLILIAISLAQTAWGQTKDTKALVKIHGGIDKISVSPNEKIWLTTRTGNTYFADHIQGNWHHRKPLSKIDDSFDSLSGSDNLDGIFFFNKDTAIMTGYISIKDNSIKKDGIYWTKDAGKTWKLIDFGGDTWIYHTCVDKNGHAWMGGSSGALHYSEDYGKNWKKLNSPYDASSRLHTIFMRNPREGISGALGNRIHTTMNNWKTFKAIETPMDQKKYKLKDELYSDHRIEKVFFWKHYMVVNQEGRFFYTQNDTIDWKAFPIKIIDFEVDTVSNNLVAITSDLKVVTFSSPINFNYISTKSLKANLIDIKIVNNNLFVIDIHTDIYKITPTEFIRVTPYTTDSKIATPYLVKHAKQLTWGIDGKHLYLSENKEQDWFRETVFDFEVSDFKLLNDSTAVLWDGKQNYWYSLTNHQVKPHLLNKPLEPFLKSPVKQFSIRASTSGCFHFESHNVNYRLRDTQFESDSIEIETRQPFKHQVSRDSLQTILNQMNSNPDAKPLLSDFKISKTDKEHYIQWVDSCIKKSHYYSNSITRADKAFYSAVPSMLDTLHPMVFATVLKQKETLWSTTHYYFKMELINQQQDTLSISARYYQDARAWHLPWQISYNGLHFNCYDLSLSQYINHCIPNDFMDKSVFDNKRLIMQIANYLHSVDNEENH